MRIALYGGSFDPPHVAHQMACLYALQTQDIDEVWMLPCFQHPFDKRSAPFTHRVAMCRLAAAALPGVAVCTIEEELPSPSYTLLTVRALQERLPQHQFLVMIGADLVAERERWYRFDELARLAPFLVIGRAGVARGALAPGDHTPGGSDDDADQLILPAVSSTRVREVLRGGGRPAGLVSGPVLDYIQQHGLYQ